MVTTDEHQQMAGIAGLRRTIEQELQLLDRTSQHFSMNTAAFASWQAQFKSWRASYSSLLSDLESVPQVVITLVGSTGAGKSTLINAVLDDRVLATSNVKACTSAVTEVTYGDRYSAVVEFVPLEMWYGEVQSYADELADLRDEGSEIEARARHGEVQRKIEALYEAEVVEAFYDDLDVDYLRTSGNLPDLVTGSAATVSADSGAELREQLRDYVASDGRFWPLVKRTVVRGPFDALRYGATVVDLPGLNDPNPAREAVTTQVLQKTNFVWLVYNMRRALTREITDVLRERDLFRRLVLDGRYGGLTAVGTAADAIDPEVDGETFGIDPEAELAIAEARGAESRKHVVEQLSDLVNQLEDASSDSSTHAIGERMRGQLAAIPSFSVSARDYLDLIGAQRHRQRLAPDEEATGIPELVRHIGEMSRQNGPDAHAKSIENRLQALRVEVRAAAAQSKNFSRSRDSVDFGKEVQSAARDAELVKQVETAGGQALCMSASGVGWLIQATVGNFGASGCRWENRSGLAA